ncbi:MAG: VWA domain-containing protein [Bacteroidota bacterium]
MKTKLAAIFAVLIFFFSASQLWSATHSLTKWEDGKFDLVVSLGWIPDADDKTKLKTVFELFAQDVWTMTEGHHSLRRLYVYTPNTQTNKTREWSKADIRFLNTADAANATIAGFKKTGRIFVDDDLSDLSEVGHALAHELGHYAYAVYDEYKDDQGPKPGFPHTNDTPKNSIMNYHWEWQNFSVPDDYKNTDERKTAHYRMYGESIWETLISDSVFDSLWGDLGYLGYKNDRYVFSDLQGLTSVPLPLKKPTDNPDLEIIYMEGSEACIIIDDSGSMGTDDKMASAISGAKSYLDKMKTSTDYAAVVAFNSSASTIGALGKLDNAKKAAFKTAIDGLSAGGGTSFDAALSSGYNILSSSTRKGTYKYIVLLSDGEASVPYSVLTQLKDGNIPVYAIGLGSGADMNALGAIASGTDGKSYYTATSASLNAIYSDIASISTDEKLTARVKENLNINKNTASAQMKVDSTCQTAEFSTGFPVSESISLELTSPSGEAINASNAGSMDNVTLISEDGYITYKINNPESGTWKLDITASGLTEQTEVIMEGKTDSDFSIDTKIIGGNYPEPILAVATVSKNYPVKGLNVEAEVTAPDGSTSPLQLLDNGVSPDVTAGDGQYAAALTDYTDGSYTFTIAADNSAGTGTETSKGVTLKNGTSGVENPVSADFRIAKTASATASGVAAHVPNNSIADSVMLTVNTTPVRGAVENDEDISYYYFDAEQGKSYTIYTARLFPETMKTLVKIYDSADLDTPLEQDSESMNQTSAKIIYTADEDKEIYVTVEHGSPGTGTYDIAVRETQSTDSMEQPQDLDEGGSSDDFSCFIGTLKFH